MLDETVRVYDVFGIDRHLLPVNISLTTIPYMVDKYISFKPSGPYIVNTPFTLDFNCMDYLDQPVAAEEGVFRVVVDGVDYDDIPENGILRVQVTCPDPKVIPISISGPGYLPFQVEVEVVPSA